MIRIRTRIAPTPSGLLHVGNAWSFTLTWLAARANGGTVHLRIDDLDAERARDEYLDDIFDSLRWLGLDWDSGPAYAGEFRAAHSQRLRLARYQAALDVLAARGSVYACACSRSQVRGAGGTYPGTCRDLGLDATAPDHALRFRLPDGTVSLRDADGAAFELHPRRDLGDFVLRRKTGGIGYQLASVLDDEDLAMDFIVRGLDLMPSTGAQIALAKEMGLSGFARARFWHHPLILDDAGEKLSKSRGAESLRALRERFETPAPLFRWFAGTMGRDPGGVESVRDLLEGFTPERVSPAPLRLADFWRSVGGG